MVCGDDKYCGPILPRAWVYRPAYRQKKNGSPQRAEDGGLGQIVEGILERGEPHLPKTALPCVSHPFGCWILRHIFNTRCMNQC
jgi:hypothetical protein